MTYICECVSLESFVLGALFIAFIFAVALLYYELKEKVKK